MASDESSPAQPPRQPEAPAKIRSPDHTVDDAPAPDKAPDTQDGGGGQAEAGPSSGESLAGGSRGGSPAGSTTSSQESGEISPTDDATADDKPTNSDANNAPPLPVEAPPLPNEQPPPAEEDDGWDFQWDPTHQAYFFYNRFTHATTWENPRLPNANANATASSSVPGGAAAAPGVGATDTTAVAEPPKNERPPAGGYNPAIHGDYDPNAWYAKGSGEADDEDGDGVGGPEAQQAASAYAAMGSFNRFTGQWQAGDQNPEKHNDEAKSRRQMNAYFDVDAAANSHDGRSLKAERSGKKPSRAELKAFKEKRRAKKEEKRRAWLRD